MSRTLPHDSICPSKYAGIGSAMAARLEEILKGEKVEIGKGILAGALRLLNLADYSFAFEGYPRKSPETNVNPVTAISARQFITEAYENATGIEFRDTASIEETIRELIDLTESLQHLDSASRNPPEPVEGYKRLKQFYQAVRDIGNRDREIRTFYNPEHVYTPVRCSIILL